MNSLLMLGYEFFSSFLPFCVTFCAFLAFYRRRGVQISFLQKAGTVAFAIYGIAVFYLTGAGTLYDALLRHMEINASQINVILFSHTIDVVAYLQNVLLFVPLGVFLPFLWSGCGRGFAKLRFALLSGFGFSLLIEISQLLNNRRSDIDDLLLNTLGAVLGYALYKAVSLARGKTGAAPHRCGAEAWVYLAVMFAGRFFLFYEMGLAKLLYGF